MHFCKKSKSNALMHYFPQITFLQSFNGWKCFQNWFLLFCSMLWSHYCFVFKFVYPPWQSLLPIQWNIHTGTEGMKLDFPGREKHWGFPDKREIMIPKRPQKTKMGTKILEDTPNTLFRSTSAPVAPAPLRIPLEPHDLLFRC